MAMPQGQRRRVVALMQRRACNAGTHNVQQHKGPALLLRRHAPMLWARIERAAMDSSRGTA
jgi:hypothetical protein